MAQADGVNEFIFWHEFYEFIDELATVRAAMAGDEAVATVTATWLDG